LEPVVGFQVPTSAIFVDADAKTCVFTTSVSEPDLEDDLEAVPVVVEQGTVGSARIQGALGDTDRILVNVSVALERTTCS
jgi:hypothetical protein